MKYVLKLGYAPISQYGIVDYFLIDTVDRDLVRRANNNLIRISDEMYVFGPVSDGVLAEILMVKKTKKPIKYFKIVNSKNVKEIKVGEIEFEKGLEGFRKNI
ncbi:hypothetical protein HY798_05025 [Candidatus Falkowbacteria bacterium]|nr:hypothetical protein [Candidatus Falkowbacteria bacterium]